MSTPVSIERIFNPGKYGNDYRLILRVSIRLSEFKYMPVSFVLDTSVSKFY
jgi:hypothetical protein